MAEEARAPVTSFAGLLSPPAGPKTARRKTLSTPRHRSWRKPVWRTQEQSQPPGQRQHDLPDRHPRGQDPLDQMAAALCHPAPTTGWAEPAAAARERHEAVVVAGSAMQIGEAPGEGAAARECLQLPPNEPRDGSPLGFGGVEQTRELVSDQPAKQGAAGRCLRTTALDRARGCCRGGEHRTVESKNRAGRISGACAAPSGVDRHPFDRPMPAIPLRAACPATEARTSSPTTDRSADAPGVSPPGPSNRPCAALSATSST